MSIARQIVIKAKLKSDKDLFNRVQHLALDFPHKQVTKGLNVTYRFVDGSSFECADNGYTRHVNLLNNGDKKK